MKILRYIILSLTVWALPSFLLAYFSPSLGTLSSHLIYVLLIIYFLFSSNRGPILWPFLLLGLSYYLIGGFNRTGFDDVEYATLIVKFVLLVVCGATVMRDTSESELYYFLLLGSISIAIHATIFPLFNAGFSEDYGRYSGFYLNPNGAGSVCLMALALSFGIKNVKVKYVSQLIITIAGFVTFSRSFLLMWLILNLLSILINRKNFIVPLVGSLGLIIIFFFSSSLQLNSERFNAIGNIFNDQGQSSNVLQKDSRTETWASYKDVILNKPILGNGFKKLQGNHFGLYAGVHNTFLLVWGEAGVFPFLIIVCIYAFLMFRGFKNLRGEPQLALLAIVLFTALLVSHNYFDKFYVLLCSIFLYVTFVEKRDVRITDVAVV